MSLLKNTHKPLVVAVAQPTVKWLNELTVALYTLRKNGGALASCDIHIVFNHYPAPRRWQKFFTENFNPITFEVLPRITESMFIGTMNKFNMFRAEKPKDYSCVLYLDCDTMIVGPLDELIETYGDRDLSARQIGLGKFPNVDGLANALGISNDFVSFNAGVMVYNPQKADEIYDTAISTAQFLLDNPEYICTPWYAEEAAISLLPNMLDINWDYFPARYNSFKDEPDMRILHWSISNFHWPRNKLFSQIGMMKHRFADSPKPHFKLFWNELYDCFKSLDIPSKPGSK